MSTDTDLRALLVEALKAIPPAYPYAELRARITAALAEKDDGGKVWVGYAREMPNSRKRAEEQLAELQEENKKLLRDLDAEEAEHAEHVAQAKHELAELQAKHDALVKQLREPSNKLLSDMMYAWEHSFGTPYTRHKSMLNVAVDAAMPAVALDKGGK